MLRSGWLTLLNQPNEQAELRLSAKKIISSCGFQPKAGGSTIKKYFVASRIFIPILIPNKCLHVRQPQGEFTGSGERAGFFGGMHTC